MSSRWISLAITAIACVSIALLGIRLALAPTNSDTYFHLRLGHEFLTSWSARAPGSVTQHATSNWLPTQWLSELVMAKATDAGGMRAMHWLTAVGGVALASCLYWVARRHTAAPLAVVIFLFALLAVAPAISGRPQVISLAMVALLTSGWLRATSLRTIPWWIIPGTWVWAMLHGMWISGVLISLVAATGLLMDHSRDRRLGIAALAVPVTSLVVAGLTPVGPGIYGAVLRVGSISQYFTEWQAPSLTSGPTMSAGILLVVLLLHATRSEAPVPWLRILPMALAGAWLVYSDRTVSVAAAMLVALAAAQLHDLLPRRPMASAEKFAVLLTAALTLVLAGPVAGQNEPDSRSTSRAHDSVSELPSGTTVLNEWDQGGYDMWRHPDLNIVQHGYGDMFTDDELARNVNINQLNPGWHDNIERLGATHALLHDNSRLAAALHDRGWTVVARDEVGPTTATEPPAPRLVHLTAPQAG